MAIAFTNPGVSLNTTSGASSYSTSSWTPAANALLIVVFAVRDTFAATANNSPSSITHGSINFTKVQARSPGSDSQVEMWVADSGSSPGNNPTTINFTESKSGIHFHVFYATGVNLSGGAANALRLPSGGTFGGNGLSGTVTLDSPLQAANRPIAFFFHRANETLTGTANWTAVSNGNFANPNSGALSEYRGDGFDTTVGASWATSVVWAGLGAEVKAAGGVTTISVGLASETDTARPLIPIAEGWAFVGSRGTQASSTAGTTLARSPTVNITVGNWVIVTCAWDNSNVNDGYSNNLSIADTDGHTWTKIQEYTNAGGAAGAGVRIAAWITRCVTAISTSDTITITGSSVTKRTMGISEWSHPAATAVLIKGYNAGQTSASTNGPVVSVGSGTYPRMYREGNWWEKPLPETITVHTNNTNYLLELNGEYNGAETDGTYATDGPTYQGYHYVQFSGGVDNADPVQSFDQPIYRVQPSDSDVFLYPKAAAPDYPGGWGGFTGFISPRFRTTGTGGYAGQAGIDGTGEGIRLPANIEQYFNAEAGTNTDSPALIYDAERGYYSWISELHYYPSVDKWYCQGASLYKVATYGMTSATQSDTTKTKPTEWPATLLGTGIPPEDYQDDTENFGHRGVNSMTSCIDFDRLTDLGIIPYVVELFAVRTRDNAYKWPMEGGEAPRGGLLPEGTRFRLKRTIDVDTEVDTFFPLDQMVNGALVTVTRRNQIKAILHGLQEYGCYVGDNSGSGGRIRLEALQREPGRAYLWEVDSDDLKFWPYKTTWETVQDNYDPPTPSGSLLPIVERLWINLTGVEGPTADTLTGDADYTLINNEGTNDAGNDTDVRMRAQYRIDALGSDTVQYTNSVARDWATLVAAIEAISAGSKTITLGLASETDTAQAISTGGLKTIQVGLATETDTAPTATVQTSGAKVVQLGLATEADVSFSSSVVTLGDIVITLPLDTTYRVVICDLSNNALDEVPHENLQYGFELNGPGFCNFVLPILHEKTTRSLLTPGQRIVKVYRNEDLVWGGYLWGAQISDEKGVRFDCAGYLSRLGKRFIDTSKSYNNTEQSDIAWDLIDYTQSKTNGNLFITRQTANTGVTRTIKYPYWERTKILDAIAELAALADGFDFEITPDRVFKTHYPNMGTTKLELVMEFGKNVFGFSYVDEASGLANYVSVQGAGEGANMCIANSSNSGSQTQYGLLEESFSFSNIKHFDALQKRSDALLRLYKSPRWQPQLSLHVGGDMPFGAIHVGDVVPVNVAYGYIGVDQNFRITNIEYQISNEGREAVTVHFDSVAARP